MSPDKRQFKLKLRAFDSLYQDSKWWALLEANTAFLITVEVYTDTSLFLIIFIRNRLFLSQSNIHFLRN